MSSSKKTQEEVGYNPAGMDEKGGEFNPPGIKERKRAQKCARNAKYSLVDVKE